MDESKKVILLGKVWKVKEISHQYKEVSRTAMKEAQKLHDIAIAAEGIFKLPFEEINFESQNAHWDTLITMGEINLDYLNNRPPMYSTDSSAFVEIYNSCEQLYAELNIFSPEEQKIGREAISNVNRIIETNNTIEGAIEILLTYGFDKAYGKNQSPVELLKTGLDAYQIVIRDNDLAVTSLIPIRSCVNEMVVGLLRRRPKQEPTKSNQSKIHSIGKQLKYDMVPESEIIFWANEYEEILKILSPTKTMKVTRDDWRKLLQQSINFIIGFLKLLNPSKMK